MLRGIIFLTIALSMLFLSCAYADSLSNVSVDSAPLVSQSSPLDGMVRVYLSSLGSPSKLTITISGSYSLSDGTTLSSGETLTVSFSSSSGKLTLKRNGTTYSMGSSFTLRRHSTTGSNGVKIAQSRKPGNLYPGDLEFLVRSTSSGYKLCVIAHIYIENYLYGVVPYEMGSSAPLEALKAQAVAARTYTVRMMSYRTSTYYDVVDTTGDQTYNGTPTTETNCNTAVDATKGIILKYGSSYAATYYSSSNGGQTESVKNAWGSSGYSYLDVHDDPFDYANPDSVVKQSTVYANASSSYNNASLMSLLKTKAVSVLKSAGYNASTSNTTVKTIKSITPHTPKYASPSELYTEMDFTLTVTTYNASNVYVSVTTTVTCDIFDELESMLSLSIQSGENELWTVKESSGSFAIQSRRYGHGIGMSQRGAIYMGQLGYTYDEILGFYYVGTTRNAYTFTNTILAAGSSEVITTEEDPVSEDDDTGTRGVVSLGSSAQLAVRKAQSTNADVLTVLANSSPVTVLANYGSWCKIKYGSIVGYVPTSALSITGTAPDSDDTAVSNVDGFAVVTSSSYLNLRQSGSYSATILSTAPGGAILTVFSWGSDWSYIQYGKLTAYAASDFLSFSSDYPEDISETASDDTGGDSADAVSAIVATESGSLNLRQKAKAGSTVLTTIPQGATVTVTQVGTTWSAVTYFGYSGYVMTTYLSFEGDGDTGDTGETEDLYAQVTTETGSLNLRQLPKAGSSIYCTIPQYEIIVVHTMNDDWCQVTYNGITGYVMTVFLTIVDSDTADEVNNAEPDDGDTGEEEGDGGSEETGDDTGDGTPTAIVTTASGSLNLRIDALPGSRVLTRIPQGETIPVLHKMNTWTYTVYAECYGYVMNTFLTFSDTGDTTVDESDTISAVVVTASGSLNFREEPYGDVLTTIPRSASVTVYQRGSTWCYLKYNGVYGYVMTAFLSFDTTDAQPNDTTGTEGDEPSAVGDTATISVDAGSLNMRASKSDTADVLTTIPNGTVVELLSQGDDWCKVAYNGYQGYVQSQYLSFDTSAQATATPEPTATPAPTEPPNTVTAWVDTPEGSLNLRAIPAGSVLTTIPQYAQVYVLADYGETWCKTQYQNYTGYTMSKYLTTTEPDKEAYCVTAWVKTPDDGSLNLRSKAYGKVITTLPQNAKVEVLTDINDTWCQLKYGSTVGYVLSKYLTTTEPGATAQPTATPTAAPTAEPTATPEAASTEYPITAWVNTPDDGSLNLRNKADGSVITTIPQYTKVSVLANFDETWCKTQYGSVTGYTMSEYLTTTEPEEASEDASESESYSVTAWVNTPEGSLNLRSEPSGDVLSTIPQYAKVTVLTDIQDTWCKVQYGTIVGYVMSEYLTTVEPEEEPEAEDGDDTYPITAWVNTPEGSLNLRKVPNGNVLTTIPQYAEVLVFSDMAETWCQTQYDGITGYVVSKYLTTDDPQQEAETDGASDTTEESITAWVNTPEGSLNLRSEPSGDVLTTIPQYAKVLVLSDLSETWCKTEYNGVTGYTLSEYLTTTEPSKETETGDSSDGGDSSADDSSSGEEEEPVLDPTLYEPDHEIIVYVRPPAGNTTLAMYEECSVSSDVLAKMAENSEVEIIMVGETWCEVDYNGKQGYCVRDGLSFFEE